MGNLGSRKKHSGVPPHSLDKSKILAEPDDGGIVAVKYTPDAFHIPYYVMNDFQKLNKLDNGGYGTVFTGYDEIGRTGEKRAVAIKMFSTHDKYSEREIQILKTHTHPNIVELFGVIWNGNVYIVKDSSIEKPIYTGYVMEYMELGSLHNEIHDVSKQYDMKLIVLWIEQIGSGLQYLHEHEILHRDVKPKNILLAAREHLKLADFGLARNISHKNTYTTGLRGTDPYMAPEIVGTEKNYGPPADVYSFGVTIWEIICRKYPSEHLQDGNDCIELPIDPDKMSEDSWNFVKRCWQRNISDRPSVEEISAFATFGQTNPLSMGTVLSSAKYTPDGVPYHRLNDFQDLQRLDSGEYGIVYKGYDVTRFTKKKRTVAVKVFNQLDVYAQREIEILKKHSHPHIVELFGVIWDGATKDIDGTTKMPLCSGYVMEYLELGSLHNEIHDASKMYGVMLISIWIQQIGSGLQYLHEHEILHRDVKPRNILLATRTHLKLARNISLKNTYTTGPIGTNVYMAPEVITSKDYGVPADVYSFGITIWEIICRKYPSEHLQVGNDGIEPPIDPDKMSEDSWNFVKSCWQRNISDRPSIQEIIDFAAKFDQTILVVGRGPNGNKMTIWNRGTSTWTISRMELSRLPVGAVYLDDELYLIGDRKSFIKLDKNMEWKQLADMNEERQYINNGYLGWNGYIWVFGGENMDRDEYLKSVERYDPKEDKWTRMPDMKYDRYRAAAAVCNGKIYICGGIGETGEDDVELKSVECFDPESGVWTELTDMPTPRLDHSLVCYRNKLVVIGGVDGEEWTTTVLELDPHEKNGQWKELSPLTSSSSASVAAVLGREIFAISQSFDEVQIFNGINWRVGPSSPSIFPPSPSAVLVPQEFADRLSSYPVDLNQ